MATREEHRAQRDTDEGVLEKHRPHGPGWRAGHSEENQRHQAFSIWPVETGTCAQEIAISPLILAFPSYQ